jgi:hypothetical protein
MELPPSFPPELLQSMQEIRIGDYTIKAEHISGHSIDGYSIIMLSNTVVYEGEMSRSRKNGFGMEYSAKGISFFNYESEACILLSATTSAASSGSSDDRLINLSLLSLTLDWHWTSEWVGG